MVLQQPGTQARRGLQTKAPRAHDLYKSPAPFIESCSKEVKEGMSENFSILFDLAGRFRIALFGTRQKVLYQCRQRGQVFYLALPNHKKTPPKFFQLLLMLMVSFNISVELRQPILGAAFRKARDFTPRVTMLVPEAAMNENNLSKARKNEVGLAWQILSMQTKAVA